MFYTHEINIYILVGNAFMECFEESEVSTVASTAANIELDWKKDKWHLKEV